MIHIFLDFSKRGITAPDQARPSNEPRGNIGKARELGYESVRAPAGYFYMSSFMSVRRRFVHTTNSVEGFFATLKRGIDAVNYHVGRQHRLHLHRYLSEFDFRYNAREGFGCRAPGFSDQTGWRKEIDVPGFVKKKDGNIVNTKKP